MPRFGRFEVEARQTGMRLDAFVARRTGVSGAAARRLIEAGLVTVGERSPVKGRQLSAGDLVQVTGEPGEVGGVLPGGVVPDHELSVSLLYVDAQLVAIDKPAGVPSHPLRGGETGTAANAIVARFPECASASADPREGGLGHRLDTGTSGVLIAARSRDAWNGLRSALAAEDCHKLYLCLVHGAPPDVGRMDAEIGRSGRRGRVVRVGGGRQPRAAETTWRVLRRGVGVALVEARLHAGRAHQVRAHLAAAGFPIVGDDRYGTAAGAATAATRAPGVPSGPRSVAADHGGLRLHAAAVHFRHPSTGVPLVIEAPAPPWARVETLKPAVY